MGQHISSEQILTEFKEKMGEELGAVFHKIYNEVIFLHQKWYNYLELYGVNHERVQILNTSAPFFFAIIQKGLFENIIMSIARLTDPEKTGKYKNLSIRLLPLLITNEELRNEITLQIDNVLNKSAEFARERRRKLYAHTDYMISLEKAKLQEKASKENIELVLDSFRNLLDTITNHYLKSKTFYEDRKMSGGSLSLLYRLQESKNLEAYLKKLRMEGNNVPDELLVNRIGDEND